MIRKATLEDVPQLVSLATQMWKSYTVEDLTKILVFGFISKWDLR